MLLKYRPDHAAAADFLHHTEWHHKGVLCIMNQAGCCGAEAVHSDIQLHAHT